jgi:hypothetical protein
MFSSGVAEAVGVCVSVGAAVGVSVGISVGVSVAINPGVSLIAAGRVSVLVKDGVASGLPGCVDSFVDSGNGVSPPSAALLSSEELSGVGVSVYASSEAGLEPGKLSSAEMIPLFVNANIKIENETNRVRIRCVFERIFI